MKIIRKRLEVVTGSHKSTYFSSGGGGRAPSGPPSGERGGVFSFSIIASGASGGGSGLTEFVSIDFLRKLFNASNAALFVLSLQLELSNLRFQIMFVEYVLQGL